MPHPRRPAWSLVAAAACWGSATAISKRAVDEIAPLVLLPIELTVSVAVLLVAAAITGERRLPSANRAALGWLGVLNPGLAYALGLAGLALITASASAVLWAIEPILIVLSAWTVLRQRPTLVTLCCAAVALVGVILVVAGSDVRLSVAGVLLTLAGVSACAVYTVASSRYLGDASPLGVVLLQQLAALAFAVLVGVAAVLTGHGGSLGAVSAIGWASALAAGALYYGVAFWFYLRGLRTCPPAIAGLFINLVPVFGVTSAALLLGERLDLRQWIGCAVTVAAVTAVAKSQAGQTDRPATPVLAATAGNHHPTDT
jgi:probable blue pigment (indigoidine) exporter